MVVLSVAIMNKKGKVAMARQYVPMSRLRIEGLLAAFPKLVLSDEDSAAKQHTFIETDEVRYVYQPMDTLYLLLITNMQSNIIEDLNTLRMIAKLIPEYCQGHDEEAVQQNAFDLLFAIDEVISPMGYREQVNFKQIQQFVEMDSAEEKLNQIIVDSKIHNQQELLKKKAKEFDKQRMKERAAAGGGRSFPGSEYLSSLGGGFSSSDSKAISSDQAHKMSSGQPSIISHGFGSDSYQGTSGSGDRSDDEDHGLGKSSWKSPAAKLSKGPRQKGLTFGSKSKKSDALFKQAMEADQAEMSNLLDLMDQTRAVADTKEAEAESGPLAPVELHVSEKLVVALDRDGELKTLDVKGELDIVVNKPDYAKLCVRTNVNPKAKNPYGRVSWKLHPNMDPKAWKQGLLRLRDAGKAFRVGRACKTGILKWKLQSRDEDAVPVKFEFWPEAEMRRVRVIATYSVDREDTTVTNCVVAIPCPDTPEIDKVDGSHSYDARAGELHWILGELTTGDEGTLEYRVDGEMEDLWPLQIHFDMQSTFSGIEVQNVVSAEDDEEEYEYDAKTTCHADKFVFGES